MSDLYETIVKVQAGDKSSLIKVHDTARDLHSEFHGMYPAKINKTDRFVLVYLVKNYKSYQILEDTWKKFGRRYRC